MLCKSCGSDNKPGRRFCSNCGSSLSMDCPECGFENEPNDKFCGGCAAELNKTELKNKGSENISEPQGELRQVTILFADIVDYTRISSEKDPEFMHHLLSRFFEYADGIVQSYGGRVDKHIGDAVMAVFGAPLAHGNDPERAVRAAVDIHQAMIDLSAQIGIELSVHIGIASGQVVASGLGSAAHQEYTVTGTSVNLASRLAEMAKPEETLISNNVHHAAHKLVDADMVGNVSIKGLSDPVDVWRLNSLGSAQSKSNRRALVGRVAELRQFKGILETYKDTGTGHVLYVRGEAGIGKTRLVEELTALAEAEGIACYTGLVLDFGVGKGQEVIPALVRSIVELNAASDQEERIKAAQSVISNDLLQAEQSVFLNDLLDIPQPPHQSALYDAMDNETRNKGKQKTFSMLVRNMSLNRPLLLVVEDLHSADKLTLAYLARLYDNSSNYPLILIYTSRVEGDPLEKMRHYATRSIALTTLDLGPLREEESLQFANEFNVEKKQFAKDCVHRAEGNPLYLEQLLLGSSDENCEEVPGSVNSIVLARIDTLSLLDKQALQAASVLGQRFCDDVIKFLINNDDYDPEELVSHYLVRPMEGEYIFAHALVWESVYTSILRARRKELHEMAAQWFADKDTLLYAEHLERAANPGAPGAYVDAASSQMKSFNFERALQTLDRGLGIATEKADIYNLLMLKGQCLREIGKPADSIEIYQSALEASGSDVDKCRASIGLAAGMRVTDNFDDALTALAEAEQVARSFDLRLELSQIQYYRGNLYFPLGNLEGCLEQHGLALETAKLASSPECEARAMSGLGDAYYSRGQMITSLNYFRQCIDLCKINGFGRIMVENHYMVAWNRVYLNEIREAAEEARMALDASILAGHKRAELISRITTSRALCELADYDAAEEHILKGIDVADRLGSNRFKPFLKIFLGKVRLKRDGMTAKTKNIMQNALEISRNTGIGFLGPWVMSILALALDDKNESLEILDEGQKILDKGCVGHNYIDFYSNAMEVAWMHKDWDLIETYADALEDYIKPEPLPQAEYYIKRGRALASHERTPSVETAQELQRIKQMAEEHGLLASIAPIEQALNI